MTAAYFGVRNRVLTYRHVSAVCSEPNDARSVLERPRLARRGRCEGLKAQSAQHWIQVPKDARSLIEVAVNVHVSQLRGVHRTLLSCKEWSPVMEKDVKRGRL